MASLPLSCWTEGLLTRRMSSWSANQWMTLTLGFVGLCLLGVAGFSLWRSSEDIQRMRMHDAGLQARMIEDQFTQMLHLTHLTVDGLQHDIEGSGLGTQLTESLEATVQHLMFVRSISLVIDEVIVASSNPKNLGHRFAHEDLQPQRGGEPIAEFLRVSQAWSGRDLADGQPFAGDQSPRQLMTSFIPVIKERPWQNKTVRWVVAINPDYLGNAIHAYMEAGVKQVDVIRYDGALLYTSVDELPSGQTLIPPHVLGDMRQHGIGYIKEDLLAYRSSRHYPFFVVSRLDRTQVMNEWWSEARRTSGLMGLMLAILTSMGVLLVQRIRKSRASESALAKSRGLIARVFEDSTNGILIADAQGRVVVVNSRFERTCGMPSKELAGRSIGQCIELVDGGHLQLILENDTGANELWQGEVNVHSPSRPEPSHEWLTLSAVRNPNHDIENFVCVFEDLNRERQHQQMIRRLSQAVEQSPTSIIITDLNSVIEYVNPHFYRITGYEPEQVIGQKPKFLSSGLTPESTYADMWETLGRGLTWEGEFINCHRNGDICYQRAVIAPIRNASGKATHYLAVELDVTDQHRQAVLLEVAHRAAQAANVAKTNFLANMSHEIRTPMNGIIGMSELILQGPLSDEQRERAQTISNSAQGLLSIINDLLDFSKIEAGKMRLEHLPFSPAKVAQEVVNLLRPVAQDKKLGFRFVLPDVQAPFLVGDANRLRQIILNLLDNAIKFTQGGEVSLEMRQTLTEDGLYELQCTVQDTGIGMTPEVLTQLFNPFYQGDASMSRRFGGTGLGLSISRRLAELMGGRLQAKSVHGKGSEFVLSLLLRPALQAVPSPNVPLAEGAAQTTFEGLKVLLVEDNAVNQKVAKSLLVRMGCMVDTASNGIEAIATLQQKAFDVVFMDCQMPLMDGLDATRRIRAGQAGERSQGVWILAMTAHAMPGDRERCIEAGMNDYLTKPVRMSDLQQALQRLLTRQESAAA